MRSLACAISASAKASRSCGSSVRPAAAACPAEGLQVSRCRAQRLMNRIAIDAAGRALAHIGLSLQQDRRPAEAVHQARADDADDSPDAMIRGPARLRGGRCRSCADPRPCGRPCSKIVRSTPCRCVFWAASLRAIASASSGAASVSMRTAFRGMAHAPAGVQARRDHEADLLRIDVFRPPGRRFR